MQSKREDLYRVSWHAGADGAIGGGARQGRGGGRGGAVGRLASGSAQVADVAALRARLDAGETAPERVIIDATTGVGRWTRRSRPIELPSALQAETVRALGDVQALLAEARLAPAALVWVTSSAISTGADDGVDDLVHAPLWGLLRSTRNEHADRVLRLVDVGGEELTGEQLWPLLDADGEPELAWRNGQGIGGAARGREPSDKT